MAGTGKSTRVTNKLATERDVVEHLVAAFDSDRPRMAVKALQTISDARGLTGALKRMRMTRGEYRAQVLPRGCPRLDVVVKLAYALNLRFTVSS